MAWSAVLVWVAAPVIDIDSRHTEPLSRLEMDLAATSGVLAPSQSRSSSRELNYPPLYAFPPFFTLQPNATTLATQLAQWSNLVLAWCRHHRAFVIDVEATSGADIDSLWQNKSIDRRLDVQSRRKVLESMVNDGEAGLRRRDARSIGSIADRHATAI